MNHITSEATVISSLLNNRYKVQYYQREYSWKTKQIQELIEDLTNEFYENYDEGHTQEDVEHYEGYFLGPVIMTKDKAIIDGQQRLSSITLLLIYLNHLQQSLDQQVDLNHLIFSSKFGKKTFSINVPERKDCLESLYEKGSYDEKENDTESVINLANRYRDIEALFPDDMKDEKLLIFIEWLIEKVVLVEINANSEQDAHKVFVAMNDRGLRLTPVEMLKGYLLSEIKDNDTRNKINGLWKYRVLSLKDLEKDGDTDFIKTWLRSQYAEFMRVGKRDSEKKDFEIIGDAPHKWVRENRERLGLIRSKDFEDFVAVNFEKYAEIYGILKRYATNFNKDFEFVYYNADRNFTLQYQMILAAIDPEDDKETIEKKIRLVSRFIDQWIIRRVFSFRTMNYSSVLYTVFNITKEIRRRPLDEIASYFKDYIEHKIDYGLEELDRFYLNRYTARFMLHILARMTAFIESESGINSSFVDYVNRDQKNPYDIEHLWANDYMQGKHEEEFESRQEFESFRNMFGGLVLLPKDKNRSFQDMTYEEKSRKYFSENLLAKSLNQDCYINNPSFKKFMEKYNLNFKPYEEFTKNDLLERQQLYKEISKVIWNPDLLDAEL